MVVGEEGAVLAVVVVAVVTTVLLSSKSPTLEDVLEGGE